MDKRFVMLMLMGVVIIEALVQAAEAGLISKLIHKKRRMTPNDQCPREVIDFWITVPIHDDAKKLVKEAREYYDEGKEVDPNYRVPDMTLGCQKLVWQVYTQLEQLDPCWSILAKDGKNKGFLKVLEEEMLLEELIYVKAVHEAYYACINGRNARQAMVADGVFGVLSGCRKDPEIPSENRGQCLKQAADYWQSLVPLPAAIKDRVEEARLYAKTFPNYQVPPLSQACRDLDYATMVKARRVVPCWGYVHIMGGRLESWIDLFKMSLGAREVQEAHYVCNHGLNATVVMKEKGVYEHIANWYVPTESHEQCLAKMDNYMSSSLVLIGEDIQALVYEARRHYGLDTPILGYPQPLVSVSCKKLQDAVFFGIDEVASCWNYEPLMGEKDQAWSELHDRSKAARRVSEALRACEHGNNAGLVMKQEGIFDEVVRSSDNEPEIAPKGESEIVPSEESGVVPKDEPEIVPIA